MRQRGGAKPFVPGAIVRVADGSSFAFYKLAEITGEEGSEQAVWVKTVNPKFGDVEIDTTYTDDYEIANVVSGTFLNGIKSDADEVKIVNGSQQNISIIFNAASGEGVHSFTSTLSATQLTLSPGASSTFTRSGEVYRLSCLYGITKFPDLQSSDREGDYALLVSPSGDPLLMEVQEMRSWDENKTEAYASSSELNADYPDVPIGYTVVCRLAGKVYEKVNSYNMWVSYDITSLV